MEQNKLPEMDKDLQNRAASVLKSALTRDQKMYLLGMRDAKDFVGGMGRKSSLAKHFDEEKVYPDFWMVPVHHGFGQQIRNILRKNGFVENKCGIDNWDDYYERVVNVVLDEFMKEVIE